MTDLVEWLRIHAVGSPYVPEFCEAANEIERLRAALDARDKQIAEIERRMAHDALGMKP
jgi:hypothetical protein